MTSLALASIRLDGGTQTRAVIDADHLARCVEGIEALPPIIVFYDGADHWLADGFHRIAAHEAAGRKRIAAEVKQGTRRDAILYSVGANATHGLPRTPADKRRAVGALLADEEWAAKSDRWIAKACGVTDKTVAACRESTAEFRSCPGGQPESSASTPRLGQDGKTRRAPQRAATPAPRSRDDAPAAVASLISDEPGESGEGEGEEPEEFDPGAGPLLIWRLAVEVIDGWPEGVPTTPIADVLRQLLNNVERRMAA